MARKKTEEAAPNPPVVDEAAPPAAKPTKVKKPKKAKKVVSMTPAKVAYQLAIDALATEFDLYSEGAANDDLFSTPGKQKKVAKQIAKLHNRLVKKSGLDNDPLDED